MIYTPVPLSNVSITSLEPLHITTKDLSGVYGMSAGKLTIEGTWGSNTLVSPVKLHFELRDPSGRFMALADGYRSGEFNPCCKDKILVLSFENEQWKTGQWRLRVQNSDTTTAVNIRTEYSFDARCTN